MKAQLLAAWLLEDSSKLLISAVLTPGSQQALLQRVPPKHPEVKAHHMTIAFDPPMERYLNYYRQAIGQKMPIKVVGVAEDEKGQAVRVEAESENVNAHITISCAAGVPAVYSNELLSKGWTPVTDFWLEGTITAEPLSEPVNPL